jgi:Rrf2 family cysteine metabolism transcriptional repressor
MNITSKTRYGLKTLLDIAFHHRVGPVQRRHIAIRQGIPTDYMDQILMRLRNNGLIHSLRGREGGYHLALDPEEITIWDIAQAVEDEPYSVENHTATDSESAYATMYLTSPAWDQVAQAIQIQLKKVTLAVLLDEGEERLMEEGLDPVELMESKPISVPQPEKAPLRALG